jgi:putative Ca2+/H+ antiporter (TMEM165/GDT1 family)
MSALQALSVSTATVALSEIGDKTQLLALLLATRFRKPWQIAFGILTATLINHGLSAWLGVSLTHWLSPQVLRWMVAVSFLGIGLWTLIPDKLDDEGEKLPSHGAYLATTLAFFVAEIGDKTQIATVLLATKYQPLWAVVVGTTAGMLLADLPVVWLGSRFSNRLPLKPVRMIAAAVFVLLGLLVAWRGIG